MKLRLIQAPLLRDDLGAFLGQCCHRSWEGKGVLLFFGERLEGFRLRSFFWGWESKISVITFCRVVIPINI